jgi:hypothetical protein
MANYYAVTGPNFGIFDVTFRFPQGVVNQGSQVFVSVCEIADGNPIKGLAVYTLHNVVPMDGSLVEVTIDTGWTYERGPGDQGLYTLVNFAVDPA